MYYGMIFFAVFLFCLQFWLNGTYERSCGSGITAAFLFSAGTSAVGFLVLLAINAFRFEWTTFSALMALLVTVNNVAFTLCSLRALGQINLSLYSVFSMLGGMLPPFFVGILFFEEGMTVGKSVCLILIMLALAATVERREEKKGGRIWYLGIFILNGLSGVLSKVFTVAAHEKTSEAGFSVLCALMSLLLSLLFLPFAWRRERLCPDRRACLAILGCGLLSRVANFLLLIALVHVPASTQYPAVTGGVMIGSTLLCYLTPKKPKKRELLSVLLAFIGLLSLILIPI